MKKGTSFFLDAIRLISALGVFAGHCLMPWFSSFHAGRELELWRHACVIVFFTLSGYLITFTTFGRNRTWRQYCAARLARLYSVALPAIVLTAALWLIGSAIAPDHYLDRDRGHGFVRLAMTAGFLNEIWFFSAAPPTNMPFWSLSYEFWYYAIFGAAFFARGKFSRWAAPLVPALICGPKVLLLFPAWLAGAAALAAGKKFTLSKRNAALALTILAALCTMVVPHLDLPLERFGRPPLFYSALFVSDCALGVVLAIGIFLCDQLFGNTRVPAVLSAPIKAGASVTFSIYLLHFPLLIFASAVVSYDKSNPISVIAVALAVLLLTVALGSWFERRATLEKWTRGFGRVLAKIE